MQGYVNCKHCGANIRITPKEYTGTGFAGNTRDNYTCEQCGTIVCSTTQDEAFQASIQIIDRLAYKRKHCSMCNGSGYDNKGKPCRKCR